MSGCKSSDETEHSQRDQAIQQSGCNDFDCRSLTEPQPSNFFGNVGFFQPQVVALLLLRMKIVVRSV